MHPLIMNLLPSIGFRYLGLFHTAEDGERGAGVRPLLLDMQYRMHPLIADLPSQLFYAGRLMSGVSAAERPLPTGAHIRQLCSKGVVRNWGPRQTAERAFRMACCSMALGTSTELGDMGTAERGAQPCDAMF